MPVKSPAPGELDPIETASRDEIVALQLQRLKATLARAYDNVPHYRRAFDDRGVHPRDLQSLADLAKFPFTTKKDLRDNYPFGLFAVPRTQVVRVSPARPPAAATSCTWPTATACSPAGWARTTAPSGWAARWSRCPAGRPRNRCS
jgi:hypothetical protein